MQFTLISSVLLLPTLAFSAVLPRTTSQAKCVYEAVANTNLTAFYTQVSNPNLSNSTFEPQFKLDIANACPGAQNVVVTPQSAASTWNTGVAFQPFASPFGGKDNCNAEAFADSLVMVEGYNVQGILIAGQCTPAPAQANGDAFVTAALAYFKTLSA